jgi:acyl-coenzyme A thioesterase PaaI-like protein
MASERSASLHSDDETIRARVLNAIAANRNPGLHFIGHFLDVEWQAVAGGAARAVLPDGPHCRDANGAVSVVALGILADHALAASARTEAPPGSRLGTIHLHVQFTGVATTGDLHAEAHLLARTEGATLPQSLTSATIQANGKAVCHVTGAHALLDPPPGVTLGPLPWEREEIPPVVPVEIDKLEPHERAILSACDAALKKASSQASFIDLFWGGVPRRAAHGATSRLAIGAHIANRVGHVQGGILFGLAATNACAAAPAAMMLSNLSAWYISPGRGAALRIRSRLLHVGRTFAVVRTEIHNAGGERVLEAVSNHVTRATRVALDN